MTDFIGTYSMPESIIDKILKFYDEKKEEHAVDGILGGGNLDKTKKDSRDISIYPDYFESPLKEYRDELQKCLESYVDTYPFLNEVYRFNILEPYNIQHYPVGGGFKIWHCERTGVFAHEAKRCLVFMTYLNDIEDGGTEFLYYNKTVKAEKGKTLIWPSDWTHAHRGQVSKTKEKTIVTGWYSYCWDYMG